MIKKTALLMCLSLPLMTSACVSVKSVSLTSVPTERQNVIQAEGSRFLFFGLSFSSKFIDQAIDELSSKCPNGKVEGVLTKHENVNYFLGLFVTERVIAKGFCR